MNTISVDLVIFFKILKSFEIEKGTIGRSVNLIHSIETTLTSYSFRYFENEEVSIQYIL